MHHKPALRLVGDLPVIGMLHQTQSVSLANTQTFSQGPRVHKRWKVADLREAHHSRFLLRPSALELFFADRATALLNFPSAKVCKPGGLLHR